MGLKARGAKAPTEKCAKCAKLFEAATLKCVEVAAVKAENSKLRLDFDKALAKERAEIKRLRTLLHDAYNRVRRNMNDANAVRAELEHAAKEITLLNRLTDALTKMAP